MHGIIEEEEMEDEGSDEDAEADAAYDRWTRWLRQSTTSST
jgi:hypothetical protein